MLRASQCMRPHLPVIPATATALDAARMMRDRATGSVLVEQNTWIVGIVTDADIARLVGETDQIPSLVRVVSIMSSPIIGIDADRPSMEALDLMERHQVHHLAVLQDGRIVGLLSASDLPQPVAIDER